MNERISIRLYEHPDRLASRHTGRFHPTDLTGWTCEVGDTVSLREDPGDGFVMGTIEAIDSDVHKDKAADAYKVAQLRLED